jgi:UDP-N-acetylglucosamine transferase subunit ALG13
MILVTVGAQMPFDRLIRAMDTWASWRGRRDVYAQIGPDAWKPTHFRWIEFLAPSEFRQHVQHAELVVAHAGMGSIISALELRRPILVMPRQSSLGETRNDHQVGTAKRFLEMGCVNVAFDEKELIRKLELSHNLEPGAQIEPYASETLLAALRSFIGSDATLENPVGQPKNQPFLDPRRLSRTMREQPCSPDNRNAIRGASAK